MTQRRLLSITDILTPEQSDSAHRIIDQIRSGAVPVETLKLYLESQKEPLLAKEVDPCYLYFSICYMYHLL